MRDPLLIVKSLRVTEKGTALAEKHNQYVLKVTPSATKQEIKHAVKVLFQKTAVRVNTMQVDGKKTTALLVLENADQNIYLASRNHPHLVTVTGDLVNAEQLLLCDKIFITEGALGKLSARLQK